MSKYEITAEEAYEMEQQQKSASDPRKLLDQVPVLFEDVKDGDFVGKRGWRRPRRVELVEHQTDGPVLFLAEPDSSRVDVNGCRIVDQDTWDSDSTSWVRYPNLRALWDAAHG